MIIFEKEKKYHIVVNKKFNAATGWILIALFDFRRQIHRWLLMIRMHGQHVGDGDTI